MKRITFATTCMGRNHHLSQTLTYNIQCNCYPLAEFLILDYNSPDNLAFWIKTQYGDRLGHDINYYREHSRKYFMMAHAKNLAAALAHGDIVVNIDADRYIDPELGHDLIEALAKPRRIARGSIGGTEDWSACGIIACAKNDFIALGGYDERMVHGWGAEDHDLVNRAMAMGYEVVLLPRCGRSISHSEAERNELTELKAPSELSARLNGELHKEAMQSAEYIANRNMRPGWAIVTKNFAEDINAYLSSDPLIR